MDETGTEPKANGMFCFVLDFCILIMFFFLTILVDYKVVEMMNRPTTLLSPHPMTGVYTLPIYSPHPQPHTPVQQGDAAKKLIILNMRLDGI